MTQEACTKLPPLSDKAERLVQLTAERTAAEVAGSKVADFIVAAEIESITSELRTAQRLAACVNALRTA